MRILGIDPGSRATGYGVVDAHGGRLAFVGCGVIRPPARAPLPDRLLVIHDGVVEVLAEYAPDAAAVEDLFVAANPRAALVLGHARGAAVLALAGRQVPVAEYTPRMVKQAVVGHGQAVKAQVQGMVRVLLGLASMPSSDAADALAVAICHANHQSAGLGVPGAGPADPAATVRR